MGGGIWDLEFEVWKIWNFKFGVWKIWILEGGNGISNTVKSGINTAIRSSEGWNDVQQVKKNLKMNDMLCLAIHTKKIDTNCFDAKRNSKKTCIVKEQSENTEFEYSAGEYLPSTGSI